VVTRKPEPGHVSVMLLATPTRRFFLELVLEFFCCLRYILFIPTVHIYYVLVDFYENGIDNIIQVLFLLMLDYDDDTPLV
jgi:hypothetical protein